MTEWENYDVYGWLNTVDRFYELKEKGYKLS